MCRFSRLNGNTNQVPGKLCKITTRTRRGCPPLAGSSLDCYRGESFRMCDPSYTLVGAFLFFGGILCLKRVPERSQNVVSFQKRRKFWLHFLAPRDIDLSFMGGYGGSVGELSELGKVQKTFLNLKTLPKFRKTKIFANLEKVRSFGKCGSFQN